MIDQTTPQSDINTASQAAQDQAELSETWVQVAKARSQLNLLRDLRRKGLGVPQVESMVGKVEKTKKSAKRGNKRERRIVDEVMRVKVRDAGDFLAEVTKKKKDVTDKVKVKYRDDQRILKQLMKKARRKVKKITKSKERDHDKKEKHLDNKQNHDGRKVDLPEKLARYEDLEIMTVGSKEEESKKKVDVNTSEVKVYGVELSEEEKEVLCLPPKFCILKNLNEADFEEAVEVAHTKVRYDGMDDIKKSSDDNVNLLHNI